MKERERKRKRLYSIINILREKKEEKFFHLLPSSTISIIWYIQKKTKSRNWTRSNFSLPVSYQLFHLMMILIIIYPGLNIQDKPLVSIITDLRFQIGFWYISYKMKSLIRSWDVRWWLLYWSSSEKKFPIPMIG